jgi:hypothetical protein
MSWCTFSSAKPVKHVSLIRDLNHVFTLLRLEKLLLTPGVRTGKVSKIYQKWLDNWKCFLVTSEYRATINGCTCNCFICGLCATPLLPPQVNFGTKRKLVDRHWLCSQSWSVRLQDIVAVNAVIIDHNIRRYKACKFTQRIENVICEVTT